MMLYAQVDHRYLRAVRVNGRVAFEHVLGCFDSVDDKGKVTKRVDRHYVGYAQTMIRYGARLERRGTLTFILASPRSICLPWST